jgi:hypothetical protein
MVELRGPVGREEGREEGGGGDALRGPFGGAGFWLPPWISHLERGCALCEGPAPLVPFDPASLFERAFEKRVEEAGYE